MNTGETTRIAVNGTLMRGLELNAHLMDAGGVFVREDDTAGCCRLWSIGDRYPAMLRTTSGGTSVALELWDVTPDALVGILQAEPPGLTVGKLLLADGAEVLGVLGEPYVIEDQLEITEFGGWRGYTDATI